MRISASLVVLVAVIAAVAHAVSTDTVLRHMLRDRQEPDISENVTPANPDAQNEWDTDDGGTAVILSNDNSVSQTFDDLEGRKMMMEAHNKDREEQKHKQNMEARHKRRDEEAAKQDEKEHKDYMNKSEERHKKATARTLRDAESKLARIRKRNAEQLARQKASQKAELERA